MKAKNASARSLVSIDRLSCSTICFRSYPLAEALAAIKQLGFSHVDLGTIPGFCPHFDFSTASEEEERQFVETVRASGLNVNTFTTSIGQANDPSVKMEDAIQAGLRNLRVAQELEAYGVVFNCGCYRDRIVYPFGNDMKTVAEVLRPLALDAVRRGIRPLVEAPHKALFLRTPDEARLLVDAVGVPEFGLILDINHYTAAGWSPRRAVEFIGAENIGIVHLRDGVGRQNRNPLGEGNIDFAELFEALVDGGYTGCCSFEFSDTTETLSGDLAWVRRSLDYLTSLWS